jgi:hypothetical protein
VLTNLVNLPFNESTERWGLNLPQDVFAWVKGEYGLGLVPRLVAAGDRPQADWLFVAQEDAAKVVEQGIQALDVKADQRGYSTGQVNLSQQKVVAWTKLIPTDAKGKAAPEALSSNQLSAEVAGTHVQVKDYELLASSLGVMDRALQAPQRSLLGDAEFQKAIAPLSSPNNGYFYLNWPASRDFLVGRFPFLRTLEGFASPIFSNLKSLALASQETTSKIQHSQVFIRLS